MRAVPQGAVTSRPRDTEGFRGALWDMTAVWVSSQAPEASRRLSESAVVSLCPRLTMHCAGAPQGRSVPLGHLRRVRY